MSRNAPMFDRHGKFVVEAFRQQARKIRNSRNVIEKGQELDLLEAYFKHLRQLKDPHDPAMLEFWHSGLFEEVIEILTTPMSRDLKGHLTLYHIALLTLNDVLRSPWPHNYHAEAHLKSSGPAILQIQGSIYHSQVLMSEELKFTVRDPLLGVFEVLLDQLVSTDLSFQDSLDANVLLGLAFDYYFGSMPPTQGEYSASGARAILFHFSEEAFRPDPAPYLKKVVAQHGEKHVIDRYAELAKTTGKRRILEPEGAWNLFAHLLSIRTLHKRLVKESRLHVLAMKNFWNKPHSTALDPNLSSETAQRIVFPIAYVIWEVDPSLRSTFIHDLVQNDLILLFGQALFDPNVEIWLSQIPKMLSPADTFGHLRRHVQSSIAKPQWANVWKSLNSARRSAIGDLQSDSWLAALKFWHSFGRDALDVRLEIEWVGMDAEAEKTLASNGDSGIILPRTVFMFDGHGNLTTEVVQNQARAIRNAQSVILKGQELDRLDHYFKSLAQTKDPNDPAMVELWQSGLFEEVIDILSSPLSQDQEGHLTLYRIALQNLNHILRSPWSRNPPAKAYLRLRVSAILREQSSAYKLPMGEEFKFKFRDSLLGVFGAVLMEFADDGLQRTLESDILLGFVFDYYFGWTPPAQGEYSAYGARVILFDYSEEAFRHDPAPYLTGVLARRGEKNVADSMFETLIGA
ncbi:hypothetical protein FS837_011883 [Tulasnella sp. UAMH 9824]|nr:hypothetical protein FS837_011883 [Tulasnella sp. UAMH 9824]